MLLPGSQIPKEWVRTEEGEKTASRTQSASSRGPSTIWWFSWCFTTESTWLPKRSRGTTSCSTASSTALRRKRVSGAKWWSSSTTLTPPPLRWKPPSATSEGKLGSRRAGAARTKISNCTFLRGRSLRWLSSSAQICTENRKSTPKLSPRSLQITETSTFRSTPSTLTSSWSNCWRRSSK